MKNIIIFIGSRSNYGRLYPLIKGLMEKNVYHITLIKACTGMLVEFEEEILKHPKVNIINIEADMYNDTTNNMAMTVSLVAIQMSNIYKNNHYDTAIVHGDRFETLGFAIATSLQNIPMVHMEAGEYSGNIDNKIRWAISCLADMQLTPTVTSNKKLSTISLFNSHFVGSPEVEYVLKNKERFENDKTYIGPYVVVNYNPTTNKKELEGLLNFITMTIKESCIKVYWLNPNLDPGNKDIVKFIHRIESSWRSKKFHFVKNLEMDNYLSLLANSICLIGNASSGLKECAALGIPYLLYNTRQQNREKDNNTIVLKSHNHLKKEFMKCYRNKTKYLYNGLFGNDSVVDKSINKINSLLEV